MKTEHAIDWRKTAAEIQDDYERVCKERDEYEQDALRYRWLRDNKFKYNGHCHMLNGPILWEENLGTAIDKAMEQTK